MPGSQKRIPFCQKDMENVLIMFMFVTEVTWTIRKSGMYDCFTQNEIPQGVSLLCLPMCREAFGFSIYQPTKIPPPTAHLIIPVYVNKF